MESANVITRSCFRSNHTPNCGKVSQNKHQHPRSQRTLSGGGGKDLEREDVDLLQMIWQARSRLMFDNNAKDADIIADELAKLTFDNKKIKEILTSRKQLIVGYRKEWLKTESNTNTKSTANVEQNSTGYNQSSGLSNPPGVQGTTKHLSDNR